MWVLKFGSLSNEGRAIHRRTIRIYFYFTERVVFKTQLPSMNYKIVFNSWMSGGFFHPIGLPTAQHPIRDAINGKGVRRECTGTWLASHATDGIRGRPRQRRPSLTGHQESFGQGLGHLAGAEESDFQHFSSHSPADVEFGRAPAESIGPGGRDGTAIRMHACTRAHRHPWTQARRRRWLKCAAAHRCAVGQPPTANTVNAGSNSSS